MAIKKLVILTRTFNIMNSLCLLSTIALFVIGIIYLSSLNDFDTSSNNFDLTTLQYIAVIFGFLLVLDIIFGFIVVYRRIVSLLKVYCVTVPTIILVVLATFFVVNVDTNINNAFDTIWQTRGGIENQNAMNVIQKRFQCCGFNATTNYANTMELPRSCCPSINASRDNCSYAYAYADGCKKFVEQFAQEVWGAFGTTILGVSISGTVSFVTGIFLMFELKRVTSPL